LGVFVEVDATSATEFNMGKRKKEVEGGAGEGDIFRLIKR